MRGFPGLSLLFEYWHILGDKAPMLLVLLITLWTMKIFKWRKSVRNKNNFTLPHSLSLWSFPISITLLQHYSCFHIPCSLHSWVNLQQSCKVCTPEKFTRKWHLRKGMLLLYLIWVPPGVYIPPFILCLCCSDVYSHTKRLYSVSAFRSLQVWDVDVRVWDVKLTEVLSEKKEK